MKTLWRFIARPLVVILFFVCWWQIGTVFLFPFFLSLLVHLLLKRTVRRPRPFEETDSPPLINPIFHTSSFPSGHATAAFSMLTVIWISQPENYTLIIIFLILALCIGVSRVKVGVHYPTDVIGGAVLGTLVTLVYYSFVL